MNNKAIIEFGGCYPPRPLALVDNTLLDLQNSSYPTQPHSIIANYSTNESVSGKVIINSLNKETNAMQ